MAEMKMDGQRTSGAASLDLVITKAVPAKLRPGIREITNLFVPEAKRKHGDARALMHEVCNEADRKGIVLLLNADAADGIPQDKLEKFYKGFGFVEIQQNPLLMARQANGV